jgi:DNA-binding FadR family transcriptional regulator
MAERVAAELRARILGGGGEGFRLPTQDQLVRDFGVSYPSVREAIRILETEGLVTVRRGSLGGGEIHRPDEASAAYHLGLALQANRVTLGDLATGLQLLEPLCAAECARRPDRQSAVVPVLQASVEECATFIGADGAEFTRAARRFHALVVSSTPNATLRCVVSTLVALWTAQEESWAEAVSKRGEYPSDAEVASVVKVHQRLVDDIAAGRPDEAERVARKHLAASQAFLVDRFDDGIVNAMLLKSPPATSANRRH